jgi:tRNA nucleotidyltransferase (CCA-adding enzyme)
MTRLNFFRNSVNAGAIEVCKIIHDNGYKAYLVGGCVRDYILGIEPKDWDITTNALPQDVIKMFEKTYPTGIQHGTITVAMLGEHYEVTTFRTEGKYLDGRRPESVNFVDNVELDLSRRDLTINAMAYDPVKDELIDPFNGMDDLHKGIIRAVGDPNDRFQEDGLRIMRAIRFAARFCCSIDKVTVAAIHNNVHRLNSISKERIQDELSKILCTKYSAYGIEMLYKTKILDLICPILSKSPITYQCNECDGDLETKMAYLYSCISVEDINRELRNLKYPTAFIKSVLFLVELIEKYHEFSEKDTIIAYRKFIAHIKNHSFNDFEQTLEQFSLLCKAMGFEIENNLAKYQDVLVFSYKEMEINGDDLIAIGIPRGPEIRKVLNSCYESILQDPDNNEKGKLLRMAMSI